MKKTRLVFIGKKERNRTIGIFFLLLIFFYSIYFLSSFQKGLAATYLSDSFTGTTIDTTLWNTVDPIGTNVTQNGVLSISNSYVASTWGVTALYSKNTYARTGLTVSSKMTAGSAQLLGYGDYNFQSSGTSAYMIDISGPNNGASVYALIWNNGSVVASNTACGTATDGATYTLKAITGGMEVYKDTGSGDVLLCALSGGGSISNKPIFLQSDNSPSTFDDVLVTNGSSQNTEPDAINNLVATAGDSKASLTWTAPLNGGAAVTNYAIDYRLSTNVSWIAFSHSASTATSIDVTGLTNGLGYDFRVRAINSIGTAADSNIVSATPFLSTAPGAPINVSAVAGDTRATVLFSAPSSNGGSSITSYAITSSPGNFTATGSSSPIVLTGLTNGVAYTFTVTATNGIGTSISSTASNSVTPNQTSQIFSDGFTGTTIDTSKWVEVDAGGIGGTVGDVRQNGSLTVANSYISSNWGAKALYSQESFPADRLELSAIMIPSSDQIFGYGDYDFGRLGTKAYIIDLSSTVYALSWDGTMSYLTVCGSVTSGATYKLKVINGGFEVYKNNVLLCTHNTSVVVDNKPIFLQSSASASSFDDISVTGVLIPDTVPGAPTGISAVAGNTQATVSFSAPASNGGSTITGYTVTSSPGGFTATGNSSPIIVTGLTNGVAYTFTVTALNAIGTSNPSSASSSITPAIPNVPGQVTGLSVFGTNKQALLSWITPNNGGDVILDYMIQYKLHTSNIWNTFNDGTSTSTKAIVTGLNNDTLYDFRVRANNSIGSGPLSAIELGTPVHSTTLAFVLTGESNSGGIGMNSAATSGELASRPAVQIMNLTSGNFLFENLDIGTNNLRDHYGLESYYDNSHGLELQLANSVEAAAFPDNGQVYLTKTGHGGSTISQWGIGGSYWTKFLQRTAAAKTQLPSNRQWIVWYSMGINDFIAGTATSIFKTATIAHINKIKAELPGAIFVVTKFESMPANSGYPAYNAVWDEIAASEPNVFVVSSTGADTDGANHWTYSGLKTVGSRMVATTKNVLGLNVPGTPASLIATPANNQVSLSWAVPVSNGGTSITDYLIEYKTAGATDWNIFTDGVTTATSSIVTGLPESMAYNFRVSAVNSSGAGNGATITSTPTGSTLGNSVSTGFAPQTSAGGSISYTYTPDSIAQSTPLVCSPGALYNTQTGARCTSTPATSTWSFTRDLQLGIVHPEVKNLQLYLNTEGFTVANTGAGSVGNETTFFGSLTRAALIRFQKAKNILPSVGYFGAITRAFISNY